MNSTLPERVTIVEVGPRDGLQNESALVPTATKVELVERLAATGLRHVEATSFVNPKAVPQLADASEVLTGIERATGVTYPVLVPNERGYDGALAAGATSISVFTAASESFTRRNVNAGIAESIDRFRPIVDRAASDGIHVRGYVSTAWGCPFEGPIAPAAVHAVVEQLADLGIADVSIGDTIGVAVPSEIEPVMGPLLEFDADLDQARLEAAGYTSQMIPLFMRPAADGQASGRQIQGSIKGPGAVAEITPRLRRLIAD